MKDGGALVKVDFFHLNAKSMPELVALAILSGDPFQFFLVKLCAEAEIFLSHKSFDKIVVEEDEKPIGTHVAHGAVEFAPQLVAHEGGTAELLHLALSLHRDALAVGTEGGDRFCRFTVQGFFEKKLPQQAVDIEIGITANRRGEVGVGLARQAKVAGVFRPVVRLLERAQKKLH